LDHTEDDIQRVLSEKTKERWEAEQRPYLLSYVGLDMKINGIDYRAILGEERVKGFVQRTQDAGGYRLVAHPSQKAKIGIVPAGVDFSFAETSEADGKRIGKPVEPPRHERAVTAFLRALSRLPDKDQDAVIIPVRVLTKLLGFR
jgi:hypothetical protein